MERLAFEIPLQLACPVHGQSLFCYGVLNAPEAGLWWLLPLLPAGGAEITLQQRT